MICPLQSCLRIENRGGRFSRLPEQFKGYQGFLDTLFGIENNGESKGTSSLASGIRPNDGQEPGEVRINTAPVSKRKFDH